MTQIVADHDSLWHWSLACYARAGMPALCLQAQDGHDADVCLLLCALWLESQGVLTQPARSAVLQDCAADWRARVVLPLRTLRRAWKPAAQQDVALAGLRQQLQALEIHAEQVLLERLQALTRDWPRAQGRADWLQALLPQLPSALGGQLRQRAQS